MTITLTPELEKAVSQVAQERGTTPEQLVLDTLKAELIHPDSHSTSKTMRNAEQVYAVMGSSRHLGPSRLQESKEEEKRREERN